MSSNVSPAMKRALAGGLLLLAALVVLVLGTGASGDDGGTYRVRAIFDSASFLVPGEDVKVAGVKVGTIESLDVTPQNKAAIVLRIDDPAFQDFKQRRVLHDPPAVADRREVRRLPADAAEEREQRAGAAAETDQSAATARASTCCR